MNKHLFILLVSGLLFASNPVFSWEPAANNKLELSVANALISAKEKDKSLGNFLDTAYAYAVFPSVKKVGIGLGGAYGKGIVIRGNDTVGKASVKQLTIGAQLGGQVYSEYVMFKDKTAFDTFTRGNFRFGAQVSAVALKAGASANANYNSGVAIFTVAKGGLMYEASIGGQKFKYRAK